LLVVPEGAEQAIWSTRPFAPSVRLLVVTGADYHDAIVVADHIARLPGFVAEGGTKNVARRDGLGTPVLAAATTIGELPRHYFQAVGSGAGGIAAWEASLRLRADGRFGDHTMRLHLAQNAPFQPMVDAWGRRERMIASCDDATAFERIRAIDATVLSNRCPPYAIVGGVYDALAATDGRMYAVENAEVRRCIALVEAAEGVDIGPAAAVAVGALGQAVRRGEVGARELVLLHLTEGGRRRLFADHPIHRLAPTFVTQRTVAVPEHLRALVA
jgi:cysteate synthase